MDRFSIIVLTQGHVSVRVKIATRSGEKGVPPDQTERKKKSLTEEERQRGRRTREGGISSQSVHVSSLNHISIFPQSSR